MSPFFRLYPLCYTWSANGSFSSMCCHFSELSFPLMMYRIYVAKHGVCGHTQDWDKSLQHITVLSQGFLRSIHSTSHNNILITNNLVGNLSISDRISRVECGVQFSCYIKKKKMCRLPKVCFAPQVHQFALAYIFSKIRVHAA